MSKPKFTTEAAQALGVKEIVSSFDSAFPTDTNRTINLTIASNTINGTLIKPGETFSMNGILGERTTAKGYREGNYIADTETLARLEGEGLVAFRYADAQGNVTHAANPNGSLNNIAGIYSPGFNVLGLMPHPENLIDSLVGGTDGRGLFQSLVGSKRAA